MLYRSAGGGAGALSGTLLCMSFVCRHLHELRGDAVLFLFFTPNFRRRQGFRMLSRLGGVSCRLPGGWRAHEHYEFHWVKPKQVGFATTSRGVYPDGKRVYVPDFIFKNQKSPRYTVRRTRRF